MKVGTQVFEVSDHLLIRKWKQSPPESWNLCFWSQCHLLIKRQTHHDQKVETHKHRFLKSVLLADQKVETTPSSESWNLGFWSQCHLLIKRLRTPWLKGRDTQNLGFWSQCHLLINMWRQAPLKVGTYIFEVSVTCLSKGGDIWKSCRKCSLPRWRHHHIYSSWDLGFLRSVSLADQKVETPWSKGRDTQTYVFEVSVICWSKDRDNPPVKVGTWVFEVSVTCWSKGRDTMIKRRHPKAGRPWSKRWRHPNIGFWSQYCLLIKRWRQPPPVKVGT